MTVCGVHTHSHTHIHSTHTCAHAHTRTCTHTHLQTDLVEVSAAVSSSTLLDGQAHHLGTVVNSSHVIFYLDGTHLMAHPLPEGASLNDQDIGSLYVGGWQMSQYEGVLQDVRVYSQPLSAG